MHFAGRFSGDAPVSSCHSETCTVLTCKHDSVRRSGEKVKVTRVC